MRFKSSRGPSLILSYFRKLQTVQILTQKGSADAQEKMLGAVRSQPKQNREGTDGKGSPLSPPHRGQLALGNTVTGASGLTCSADRGRSAPGLGDSHLTNGTVRPSRYITPPHTPPLETNRHTSTSFSALSLSRQEKRGTIRLVRVLRSPNSFHPFVRRTDE